MPVLDSDLSLIIARGERERSVRVMMEGEVGKGEGGEGGVTGLLAGVYIDEIIYESPCDLNRTWITSLSWAVDQGDVLWIHFGPQSSALSIQHFFPPRSRSFQAHAKSDSGGGASLRQSRYM